MHPPSTRLLPWASAGQYNLLPQANGRPQRSTVQGGRQNEVSAGFGRLPGLAVGHNASGAQAQSQAPYPNKPIRILIPTRPAG